MVLPTNWDQYSVADILRMVSENVDPRNWDQVASWRNMAILCDHHAARLRSAAAVLAHQWSPAKNPTAARFTDFVGGLVHSMEDAAAAARSNAGALEAILTELLNASIKVKTVAEERRRVVALRFGYFGADKYDEQARQVMRHADAAIADERTRLVRPPAALSQGDRGLPLPVESASDHVGQPTVRRLALPTMSSMLTTPSPLLPQPWASGGGSSRNDDVLLSGGPVPASRPADSADHPAASTTPWSSIVPAVTPGPASMSSRSFVVQRGVTARATASGSAAAAHPSGNASPRNAAGIASMMPMTPPPIGTPANAGRRTNPVGGVLGLPTGTGGATVVSGRRQRGSTEDSWTIPRGGPP